MEKLQSRWIVIHFFILVEIIIFLPFEIAHLAAWHLP
jgi:hypothetical protein